MSRDPAESAGTGAGGPEPPRIEIAHLTKLFERKAALAEVSLTVEPGSFMVLLGPSGSGKSTLLRCLAGIERVTAGTVHLGGTLVASERMHLAPERRGLAMVFQDYALWPHLTVAGNVGFALRRRHLPSATATRAVHEMLERVGLAHLATRYPSELSGGEQQRVALARALVADPGLLLFDEPLSNLDADLRERLRVEIATLTRESNATAVYITHDQAEAFALADQIGVLEEGHLVQCAPPEELYLSPATPFVARFTGLAGELPGTLQHAPQAGHAAVRVGTHQLLGRLPASGRTEPGGRARLLIRASAVTLCSDEEPESQLAGVVSDVAFRGRGYDHVIEVDAGGRHRLTGIFHPRRHRRGATVRLRLDPAGCLAFPDEHEGRDDASTPPAFTPTGDGHAGGEHLASRQVAGEQV